MKPTTFNLPSELSDKIDKVAQQSERSRSFVVRKLLETALCKEDRDAALQAIAISDAAGKGAMNTFDKVASGRQTFAHEAQADYPRPHVPKHLRAYYAAQSREFSCKDLAREGYSDTAIAEALEIDVRAVRKITSAQL